MKVERQLYSAAYIHIQIYLYGKSWLHRFARVTWVLAPHAYVHTCIYVWGVHSYTCNAGIQLQCTCTYMCMLSHITRINLSRVHLVVSMGGLHKTIYTHNQNHSATPHFSQGKNAVLNHVCEYCVCPKDQSLPEANFTTIHACLVTRPSDTQNQLIRKLLCVLQMHST